MDVRLKGNIFIVLGILVIFFAAAEFVLKAAVVIFGLYLVYKGLQLKNAHNILFYIHRFRDRF